MDIRGIFPALVTPFALRRIRFSRRGKGKYLPLQSNRHRRLRCPRFHRRIRHALARGSRFAFSPPPKKPLLPARLLIAGTGAESTAETIARTKRAAVARLSCRSRQNSLLLQTRLSRRNLHSSLPRRRRRLSDSDPALLRAAIHRHHPRNSGNSHSRRSIPTSSASKTVPETSSVSAKLLPARRPISAFSLEAPPSSIRPSPSVPAEPFWPSPPHSPKNAPSSTTSSSAASTNKPVNSSSSSCKPPSASSLKTASPASNTPWTCAAITAACPVSHFCLYRKKKTHADRGQSIRAASIHVRSP